MLLRYLESIVIDLVDLAAHQLVSLVLHDTTKRNVLFLVYINSYSHTHNLKIKTYLQSTHLLKYGVAPLNTS